MLDRTVIKQIVKGSLTFLPGWQRIRRKEGGGASSARYCYSVWLRHLILAARCGFTSHPEVVAELGPGDSIGAGLAAVLSGCRVYLALDVVPFTVPESNLKVFEELVHLFRQRSPLPDDTEFPDLYPRLDHYAFPDELFPGDHLEQALADHRVRMIREILQDGRPRANECVSIRYIAPWDSTNMCEACSADMIFSQAVMEHVDDLQAAYQTMHQALKPGGIISHEIDFKSHGTARHWDGHWGYSDLLWKIIKGRRPYFLNRQACGHHLDLVRQAGFEIVSVTRQERMQSIPRADLCDSMGNGRVADIDLCTSSAHIIALKKDPRGNG